ncbi:hypothetical protein [Engelhardtia mirabilis]|uniref:Nickel uptake substrate-specific transmembrane region n=1 Tax=Engelhardtia mirabilis TaxID=2528011 RepID=A0A518BGK5_9BACT|nr:hypothetical protein Pla133_11850 [Planctomycetes bacterium Pla133]QDV00446.1 hypothetical protein Pla86_11850 [Planctomycetes bacterium Pla86]
MRPLLAVMVLAVALACLWALNDHTEPESTLPSASAPAPEFAAAEQEASTVAMPAEPIVSEIDAGGESRRAPVEGEGDVVGAEAEDGAELEPLVIEVVDDRGRALDGVEVVVLDRERYDRRAFRDAERELPADAPALTLERRFGQTYSTDDAGRAVHGWSGRRAEVFVRGAAGTTHELALPSRVEDGFLRVEVETPEAIVEVFGPDGGPVAGVPVRLVEEAILSGGRARLYSDSGKRESAYTDTVALLPHAVTDAEGRAFPTIGAAALDVTDEALAEFRSAAAALAEVVAGEYVGTPLVDGRATLVLPPTGSIRVEVVDHEGRTSPEPELQVWASPAPVEPSNVSWTDPAAAVQPVPLVAALPSQGALALPFVEVGREVHLIVATAEGFELERRVVAGPAAVRDEVVVQLESAEPYRVEFRLVDSDGQPVAGERFDVNLMHEQATRPSDVVELGLRTDKAGRASFEVPDRWFCTLEGERARLNVKGRFDGLTRSVREEVAVDFVRGLNDLGDLRLEPLPVIASGIVRGPDGAPLRAAVVHVWPSPLAGADGAFERARDYAIDYDSRRTLADGTFRLQGEVGSVDRVQLTVLGVDARTSEAVEVPVGSTDVELRVVATGRLRARVELPQQVDFGVYLALVRSGLDVDSGSRIELQRGVADWRMLLPGTYDLHVAIHRSAEPVLRIEGLIVSADEPCDDPRIDPIDLSANMKRVELDVRGADGERVPWFSYRPLGESSVYRPGSTFTEGELWIARDHPRSIVVETGEYAPALVEGLDADRVVQLERGWVVSLRIDDPEEFGALLQLELLPRSGDRSRSVLVLYPETQELDVHLPGPGNYDVIWREDSHVVGQARRTWDGGSISVDSPGTTFELVAPSLD